MSRRRLRTVYTSSSDEEDKLQSPHHQNLNPNPNPNPNPNTVQSDHLQQQQHQFNEEDDVVFDDAMFTEEDDIETPSPTLLPNFDSVTLNSSNSTTAVTTAVSEPPPAAISDEEFIDVPDNLSPPRSDSGTGAGADMGTGIGIGTDTGTTSFVASDCPVNDHLRRMGLNLRREWLDSCQLGLQNTVPGFANFDVQTKAKLCFGQFLHDDMNSVGDGVLPENVHQLHLVDLPGPFVLQVDEVINISCPLRERYKSAPPSLKRCLKLSMTDGVQRVFGMEYRPIKSLEALAPAGFKVVIQNVHVRRGLLMLVPEVLEILGGSVEELEDARQRLVNEVNKPPKGKRTRSGIVPPLSIRATLATWGQTGVSNVTIQPNDANNVAGNTTNSIPHATAQFREITSGASVSRSRPVLNAGIINTETSTLGRADQHSLSREFAQNDISRASAQVSAGDHVFSTNSEVSEPLHGRESAVRLVSREVTQGLSHVDVDGFRTRTNAAKQAPSREHAEPHPTSATVVQNEDAHMLHSDHPFILSGEMESPFTYLASLSTKWAAVQENKPFVRGRIKCFLTGVKKFGYKGQTIFKLLVYVDDGSLITEILVHHDVVHKAIGYMPEELTAALSSPDTVLAENTKNTLKQFQSFLINFEGTMLVEMNSTSMVPVALEMNQSCSTSDAWLLLQRLKPDTSRPLTQNGQTDVITLSP